MIMMNKIKKDNNSKGKRKFLESLSIKHHLDLTWEALSHVAIYCVNNILYKYLPLSKRIYLFTQYRDCVYDIFEYGSPCNPYEILIRG